MRLAKALVAVGAMFATGFVLAVTGTYYGGCIREDLDNGCMAKGLICDNPAWPLYAGWVINLALVVGTGPVAWRLGGRYRALFVTPLLVVPVYVVAIPVMGVAYLALCTIS